VGGDSSLVTKNHHISSRVRVELRVASGLRNRMGSLASGGAHI